MIVTPRQTVPQGATRTLYIRGADILDPETGLRVDLTSPDSVVIKVKDNYTGITTTITANQEGSNNNWNGNYTFASIGTYKAQAFVTEGSVVGVSPIIDIVATESL